MRAHRTPWHARRPRLSIAALPTDTTINLTAAAIDTYMRLELNTMQDAVVMLAESVLYLILVNLLLQERYEFVLFRALASLYVFRTFIGLALSLWLEIAHLLSFRPYASFIEF